jgi:hypothetical protein
VTNAATGVTLAGQLGDAKRHAIDGLQGWGGPAGAKVATVTLVGSAHFERLVGAAAGLRAGRAAVRARYLPAGGGGVLLAYFSGNPELADHAALLAGLLRELEALRQALGAGGPALQLVVRVGLGCIVALYYRSSTSYQIC